MKRKSQASGAGAIDLLEEAVHLLRGLPAGLYGIYALGTLPFVMAFLYFWADMSRGAFARDHADAGAAAMGLLYLWMKCWQAIFADGLRTRLIGHPNGRWTIRRAGLLALTQSALQPFSLFAVPLAVVVILPSVWVFSFYQNITALGGEPGGISLACRNAARQASTKPGQCLTLLGFLLIFTFFVWLNLVTAMAWLPQLLKMLFGVDSAFTQASWRSIFNTTYLASSFALTYVLVDPLIKAVFALRCFYGQSIQTGEDLKAELARIRAAAAPSLAIVVMLAFFCVATPAQADAPTASPTAQTSPSAGVSPAELDHSIDTVLKRNEFAWRMPRKEGSDKPSERTNWFSRVIGGIVDFLGDVLKYCANCVKKALRWIWDMALKMWPGGSSAEPGSGGRSLGWQSVLQGLLLIVIVGVAAVLAVLLIRLWQRRRRPQAVAAQAMAALPDLNDENVAADQLPEEDWLKMAREMMAQGNFRLALRALYLAGLAHLAARELIAIAIFKSNREYESELVRRARALPEVQSAFRQNGANFDRVWYGRHEVTQEGMTQFQSNLERIRAC